MWLEESKLLGVPEDRQDDVCLSVCAKKHLKSIHSEGEEPCRVVSYLTNRR